MSEAQTPQIHARLAAVLAGVKAISKGRESGKDGGPRFPYRGVDDVYNELHGLFAEHQVYVAPEIVEYRQTERPTGNGKMQLHAVVKMRYRFTAPDGSERSMEMVGEAADYGDKGLGKACQYAYKILLLQAFVIPTEGDNDPDAQSTEWGQREPARAPAKTARRDHAMTPPSPPPGFKRIDGPGDAPDWCARVTAAKDTGMLDAVRADLELARQKGEAPTGAAATTLRVAIKQRQAELSAAPVGAQL